MLWQIHRLKTKLAERMSQQLCPRCGLFFRIDLASCPHCSNIDDARLAHLLQKRAHSRMSIGKSLIYASIVIALLLVVTNI